MHNAHFTPLVDRGREGVGAGESAELGHVPADLPTVGEAEGRGDLEFAPVDPLNGEALQCVRLTALVGRALANPLLEQLIGIVRSREDLAALVFKLTTGLPQEKTLRWVDQSTRRPSRSSVIAR